MENQGLTYQIIGCAMKVHSALGYGYREVIYQRAMAIEMKKENLQFIRELQVEILYDDQCIGKNQLDFLVEEKLIVELKAIPELDNSHISQVMNYCHSLNHAYGLLINFGSKNLQFKRIYNTQNPRIENNPLKSQISKQNPII